MSINVKRLETIALRELALFLLNDTKNNNFKSISITEVRITNDLAFMTVFYSTLDQGLKGKVAEMLEENKVYIRSYLAKKLDARKMPEITFKYDEALEYGNKINDILSDLNKDN